MVTKQASSLKRKNRISIGFFSDLKKQRQVGSPYYLLLLIKIFWNLAFNSKQIQFATIDLNINGTSQTRFCTNTAFNTIKRYRHRCSMKISRRKSRPKKVISQTVERHRERTKVRFPLFFTQNSVNILGKTSSINEDYF